jgi:ornithine cyclodeaminase
MLYLDQQAIESMGTDWDEIINQIGEGSHILTTRDWAQPLKPYLRYRHPGNRIIAMPAYVGGRVNLAGIKWIASFPRNLDNNLPRAHSVTILNDPDTGVPLCIVNTPLVSSIRTAAVSGAVLKEYLKYRPGPLRVGIVGYGPIGRLHAQMARHLLGNSLASLRIFDIAPPEAAGQPDVRTTFTNSWEEAYRDADVFMACTVASQPYINLPPRPGSLQLNISLRDYEPAIRNHIDWMIVDRWEEVCREKTDIERMHQQMNLQEADTLPIEAVLSQNALSALKAKEVVMFNPMGMALFDIAIASYFYRKALRTNTGVLL